MATSNISNTILDLSGSAVSDVVVVARLKPGPGFRIYEGTEVASQVTTTSASNGAWALTLEQNEPADPVDATKLGISPSGSYYEIEEQIPDAKGGLKSWTVTVGTTSQTLYAALVTTLPADVGPTYLTQSSGDARYSQLGNIGSTSTTAVAATASQGTASSAARSDHIHNLGSIVDSSTVELSSGLIRVKDSGITTAKINALAVTKDKLAYDGGNMVFATEATRDAAIPSPVEGQQCYLTAPTVPAATGSITAVPTGVQVIYNGSVWVCTTPIAAVSNIAATTTSTSYVTTLTSDSTAISTTLVTGTTAYIQFTARADMNSVALSYLSVSVSGATTVAVSDANGTLSTVATNSAANLARSYILTGLTAGTNTFTLNYKVNANTATYAHRNLVVCGVA